MRHWEPRIASAVEAAIEPGTTRSSASCSRRTGRRSRSRSTRSCSRRRSAVAPRRGSSASGAREPGFVALLAQRIRAALDEQPRTSSSRRTRSRRGSSRSGDTYAEELLETARLVAERAALGDRWSFSFQSESPTGEPWLGPTSSTTSPTLAGAGSLERARLPRGVRLRPPRDPLGPRRRGAQSGARARAALRAHRDAERRRPS